MLICQYGRILSYYYYNYGMFSGLANHISSAVPDDAGLPHGWPTQKGTVLYGAAYGRAAACAAVQFSRDCALGICLTLPTTTSQRQGLLGPPTPLRLVGMNRKTFPLEPITRGLGGGKS